MSITPVAIRCETCSRRTKKAGELIMITLFVFTILVYSILGKLVGWITKKLKDVDWKALAQLGVMDDAAVAAWIYDKVKKNITPAIELKADMTLDKWFGPVITVGPETTP